MTAVPTFALTRANMRGFSIVPLLTPFRADGALDEAAVVRLVDHVVGGGNQGVLAAGTTGEAVSMPLSMRVRLVELAVETARGRGVVFGGIGDNCTAHSLELAEAYFRVGADAVVVHLPSYYPIGAGEMEHHLRTIADHVSGPLFLYNIPQTTRLSLPLEVVERLSHHPRIAGIKDSEPDGERQEHLARMFQGRSDFAVFCGSVPFAARAMRAGADGYVPSAGNVAPVAARALMDCCIGTRGEDVAGAQARVDAISAVYQKGRTVAQSLCAMKAVLEVLGIAERHMLPPLQSCTDAEVQEFRGRLREVGMPS